MKPPLILLLLIASISACSRHAAPKVFIDPALAVLIPKDATALAGIRMQRLEQTPFYRQEVAQSPRVARFREQFGLEPSEIWEYVIAWGNDYPPLFLLRGKFADMGMEPRLNKPDAQRMTYTGMIILGDEAAAVGFLNPSTAIAGKLEAVQQAILHRNDNNGVPQRLAALTAQIPSANQIWFAADSPAHGIFPVAEIERGWGGIDPLTKRITFNGQARTPADGETLAAWLGAHAAGKEVHAAGPASPPALDWLLGKTAEKKN